jgi:hypothetical protein
LTRCLTSSGWLCFLPGNIVIYGFYLLCFFSFSVGNFNLQKEFPDLTNVFFFEMNFFDDSWIGCCDLSKLFVRCDISQFLELFYSLSFLNVQFFNCSFLYFLSQIRKVELNDTKVEKWLQNDVCFSYLSKGSQHVLFNGFIWLKMSKKIMRFYVYSFSQYWIFRNFRHIIFEGMTLKLFGRKIIYASFTWKFNKNCENEVDKINSNWLGLSA